MHTVLGYFDLLSTVLPWPVGAQHEYVGLNQKYVMLRNFIDINNIIKHLHSGVKGFDYKYYMKLDKVLQQQCVI